ncbi:hypothetical protein Q0F98_39970 [Paenibacillus amylolyticus]|nr:hypothetical protein Q0F98_39970 [Paenibacillus amylolyticus]
MLRDRVEQLDIGITGEKITELSKRLTAGEATCIIEAEGLTVMPGVVDIHVHFNEPGLASWEGFRSGSAALAAGESPPMSICHLTAYRQPRDRKHGK